MSRFKLTLQYDGSEYYGWQLQRDQPTIQGKLEQALSVLNNGERVVVAGAGRTDTGVHARGQVAHFDLDSRLTALELVRALNGNLPPDIRINTCEIADQDFHARFSARRRKYIYYCRTDDEIIGRRYFWNVDQPDISLLTECAGNLAGKRDFSSFSKVNQEIDNYHCEIYESVWNQTGAILTYEVIANRFLHHMVRYLVGTMMAVGQGKLGIAVFKELLAMPRDDAKIFRAPAGGLVLEEVLY